MIQALLARQRVEEEDDRSSTSALVVPPDISASSALVQAMLARQRADAQDRGLYQMLDKQASSSSTPVQAMDPRQVAQYGATSTDDLPSSVSGVMMQVKQAWQRTEEHPQIPAPAGSSALIQAMLARQQAQNEYDDGY